MSNFDIKEKVRSFLKRYFPNKEWRDEDIITDALKVTSSNLIWSNVVHGAQEGINSTVEGVKNANSPNYAQAVHQLHTEKESDVVGNVTLQGVIKGLNQMLPLPFDDTAAVFKSILGNSVKIHLGRRVTDLKVDKVTITVSLETGGHSASATIQTHKYIYRGNFECDVKLSGLVLIDEPDGGVIQKDIDAIIGSIVIPVKGQIEFLWDMEQNVNMTN